jgi:predicted dienelactone hydrolase
MQHDKIYSDDLRFVISMFGLMNIGRIESIFKGSIDTNDIGVFGHSLGGSAAYNLCCTDKRVKAGINMDGTIVLLTLNPPMGSTLNSPFMMIGTTITSAEIKGTQKFLLYKDLDSSGREELKQQNVNAEAFNEERMSAKRYSENLKKSIIDNHGLLVTVKGADHLNFCDLGLIISPRIMPLGTIDAAKAIKITNACALGFFDKYLKGKSSNLIDSGKSEYQELVIEKLSN